jgi:hypothetical protein
MEPTRNAYLRSELRNILAAAALVAHASTTDAQYLAGFAAALAAIAVATGIEPPPPRVVTVEHRTALTRR